MAQGLELDLAPLGTCRTLYFSSAAEKSSLSRSVVMSSESPATVDSQSSS